MIVIYKLDNYNIKDMDDDPNQDIPSELEPSEPSYFQPYLPDFPPLFCDE